VTQPTDDQADPAAPGAAVVEEVLASLAGLEERPLEEHVSVFEAAHDRLREALSDAARPPSGA
jgi:hypothetical protein